MHMGAGVGRPTVHVLVRALAMISGAAAGPPAEG